MAEGKMNHKEFAHRMRTDAVIVDGEIRVTQELWELIADMIENSETVIPCAGCNYFGDDGCSLNGGLLFPKPDDYCSYGKAKKEESG